MSRPLVLVTGMPRSGTTPVGDLLALAPGARTLYEPLNAHVGDRRVARYFETFDDEALAAFVQDVRDLRLDLRPGLFPEDHGWRRLAKHVVGSRTTMTYRLDRLRPTRTVVWKDPFAVLMAERIARRHRTPVIVVVRPPLAVAASFVRLGWRFDVADIAARAGRAGVYDHVDLTRPARNAAALWHLVHTELLGASSVAMVDLGALVDQPVDVTRGLYAHAGLAWSPKVEAAVIRRYAEVDGPSVPDGRAHTRRRSVRDVNTYWRGVLDGDDVDVIEDLTGALWKQVAAAAA